jgi:hypothetical protein
MPQRWISKPQATIPRTSAASGGERWYEPPRPGAPVAHSRRVPLGAWSVVAIGLSVLALANTGKADPASATLKLAIVGGAADQHSCHALVMTTVAATNQIDFSLRAADALHYGCLEFRDGSGLSVHYNSLFGHISQVVKVGIDKR